MLLEGKALGGAVVGLAGAIAAFGELPTLMQDVILAAAAVGAVKVLWSSVVRPIVQWGREVHNATTSDLPDRMTRVEDRLDSGQERFESIDASLETLGAVLDTLATTERAAVTGAIEAMSAPRPPRRTDPEPRTGWRE